MLSLSGCDQVIEVQINPYACVDEFKYDLAGNPIVDQNGAQETCVSNT
jgi:hypothetical protein